MTWTRACELLNKAMYTLATDPGESRARLRAARSDIFELRALVKPADAHEAQYVDEINGMIEEVKTKLGHDRREKLTEDDEAELLVKIAKLWSMVCQGAKDEQ